MRQDNADIASCNAGYSKAHLEIELVGLVEEIFDVLLALAIMQKHEFDVCPPTVSPFPNTGMTAEVIWEDESN